MRKLTGFFGQTAFRLCLVLWTFGYILVDISATLQARSLPGVMMLANLPLLALGIAQSLALAGLMDRMEVYRFLKWPTVAVAIVVAAAIQTFTDLFWLKTLALTFLPSWGDWALAMDLRRVTIIFILYTWTLALSVGMIWSARTGDIARLNEARAAAFEAAASRAEAAALRLQLNPHFLFNTLNGIASLVVRRRAGEAEEMIGRLADFLRSSLAADPTALIPLRAELATVRAYLRIEEARFGDRMRVVYAVEKDALDADVPNFLLQPLIENAVKHGVARSRRGAIIEVGAAACDDRLVLSVINRDMGGGEVDDDNRLEPREPGIGLANTRRRLASLYGEGAAWVSTAAAPGAYRCEIGLPLVRAGEAGATTAAAQ